LPSIDHGGGAECHVPGIDADAAEGHADLRKNPVLQPLVLRKQGSTTRLAFERAMASRGLAMHPVLEIGSREGVWKAVEKGLGIGVVADFEFVAHPNLKTLRIIDNPVRTEYRIACLRERVRSPKIKAFFEIAAEMSHTPPT
jgi:DNA-binding transcriptional LysR family regulator